MKTFTGLFEEIASLDNLDRACDAAARGKRLKPEIASFLFQREARLETLHQQLHRGCYHPSPTQLRLIRDPKPRAITLSPFSNRVVHHAVVDVIEPLFARSYIHDTYACLNGRGTHRAILRMRYFLRRYRFVLQLDIRKYFPSIPHERLLARLARNLHDERVLALCRRILAAEEGIYARRGVVAHLGDPRFVIRARHGVAIGTLTSQFWGNLYLSDLDHFIKREVKVPGYLRYLDNLTCFGNSRAQLKGWALDIGLYVREHLGLELQEEKHLIKPCTATFDYLGYRVRRGHHTLGPRAFQGLERRLRYFRDLTRDPTHRELEKLERYLISFRAMLTF